MLLRPDTTPRPDDVRLSYTMAHPSLYNDCSTHVYGQVQTDSYYGTRYQGVYHTWSRNHAPYVSVIRKFDVTGDNGSVNTNGMISSYELLHRMITYGKRGCVLCSAMVSHHFSSYSWSDDCTGTPMEPFEACQRRKVLPCHMVTSISAV